MTSQEIEEALQAIAFGTPTTLEDLDMVAWCKGVRSRNMAMPRELLA
jgi:hypothetical protein